MAVAACTFKAPRLAAAVSNRTRAFLVNSDIEISRVGRAVRRDHPMGTVDDSSAD
ncbi:hypothetical protein D3C72_2528190 [compost metagenome]